jgi:hypothetical protein
VWQWTLSDTPQFPVTSLQLATRLPNGNTIINNWFNEWSGSVNPSNPPAQAIEVTPDKAVWVLRSWAAPANLWADHDDSSPGRAFGPRNCPVRRCRRRARELTPDPIVMR